ncbi:MAG: CPBP family intramembrane metalloprotease [Micropruina sp.]|uniref:CPBP family intramembrane glutamic endopeptidase n=1 Tax=Micropruina sp. TaxID=2737536 RepID=UPI0039E63B6C
MTAATHATPAPVPTGRAPLDTPAVGWPGVALRLLLALVVTLASYLLLLVVPSLPGMDPTPDARAGNWGLAVLKQGIPVLTVPLLSILFIAVLTRFVDRRPFRVTGLALDARTVLGLLLGTAISLVVVVPASVLFARLQLIPASSGFGGQPLWVVIAGSLLLGFGMQGFPEEYVWRGWLTQSLGGRPWRQAGVSAIAFGLIHIVSNGGHAVWWQGAIYITSAGAFGFAAAALYFATGSLWAAVGIHGGLHLGNTFAALLGGGEGWPLELFQIVAYLLIGLAIMRRLPSASV